MTIGQNIAKSEKNENSHERVKNYFIVVQNAPTAIPRCFIQQECLP